MNGIVWLASHPKSGNTWFRSFLTNYLRYADQPASINDLGADTSASACLALDAALGYECGDLSDNEVEMLRPEFYVHLARQARQPLFCKVHDAYHLTAHGQLLFPRTATQAVLYFVRNPLDVCVSSSHHNGHDDHRQTAQKMADDSHCFCSAVDRQPGLLRLRSPPRYASSGVRFSSNACVKQFDSVVFQSCIDRNRKAAFQEKGARAASFVRKGRIGSWRGTLPQDLVSKLIDDYNGMMRRFEYLDAQGMPIF